MWNGIALIFVGFALARLYDSYLKHMGVYSCIRSIGVDVDLALEYAQQFIRDEVYAPSYRFPMMAYQSSFPIILVKGGLQEADAKELTKYFAQVDAINRGLDLIASIPFIENKVHVDDTDRVLKHNMRNRLKAEELIQMYPETKAVIDKCKGRRWLGLRIPGTG
jgi:hypothetical protein